jgi:hypothetical protein
MHDFFISQEIIILFLIEREMQRVTKKSRWPSEEANEKTTPPCNDRLVDVHVC